MSTYVANKLAQENYYYYYGCRKVTEWCGKNDDLMNGGGGDSVVVHLFLCTFTSETIIFYLTHSWYCRRCDHCSNLCYCGTWEPSGQCLIVATCDFLRSKFTLNVDTDDWQLIYAVLCLLRWMTLPSMRQNKIIWRSFHNLINPERRFSMRMRQFYCWWENLLENFEEGAV